MTFALILDIIVTFLLAGTIYYVWQLTTQLQRFRQNRTEIDRFIRELSGSIDRANLAVAGMRAAADTTGEELQKRTRTATELSDELQLMIESANNMATRLERAAAAIGTNQTGVIPQPQPHDEIAPAPVTKKSFGTAPSPAPSTPFPSFAIRDPEFDTARGPQQIDKDIFSDDEFESESERELFRALQGRRT